MVADLNKASETTLTEYKAAISNWYKITIEMPTALFSLPEKGVEWTSDLFAPLSSLAYYPLCNINNMNSIDNKRFLSVAVWFFCLPQMPMKPVLIMLL